MGNKIEDPYVMDPTDPCPNRILSYFLQTILNFTITKNFEDQNNVNDDGDYSWLRLIQLLEGVLYFMARSFD